jgi:hypothetical protein
VKKFIVSIFLLASRGAFIRGHHKNNNFALQKNAIRLSESLCREANLPLAAAKKLQAPGERYGFFLLLSSWWL